MQQHHERWNKMEKISRRCHWSRATHKPIQNSLTHPIGSRLVKQRLRLGLAWLMGMVLPCTKKKNLNQYILLGWQQFMVCEIFTVTSIFMASSRLSNHFTYVGKIFWLFLTTSLKPAASYGCSFTIMVRDKSWSCERSVYSSTKKRYL